MLVYLDNSSTTKQSEEVTKSMIKVMEKNYGNPSSLHMMGVEAEKEMQKARRNVAASLNADENEIFFNGGGTEGDNSVIFGIAEAKKRQGNKIITSEVEHPAVLESCKKLEKQGYQISYIGVDKNCSINMEELKAEIDDQTILISIMTVNNETGAIMPISEINKIKNTAIFHTDAVQGYGKVSLNSNCADLITISGHKVHGPKGTGAIYIKKDINLPPYLIGGGQERHQRSGTENVPGIVGLGVAAEKIKNHLNEESEKMRDIRDYLREGIIENIEDVMINSPIDGSPSVLNVSFLGTRGEVILHTLEQDQIFVSTGSACSSNKLNRSGSHVLRAMGLKEKEIEGALRFSVCAENTREEIDFVIDKLKNGVERFRRLGSFR